jgi:hypothetical protein
MASKHRRERRDAELARKKGKRPTYPRVLIACEGKKTEPFYFEDIRKQYRVPSAHVRVLQADGTQPRQVVDFAEKTFNASKEYEWVFAVFDRDDHQTYHDALTRAAALDNKLKNDERKHVRFLAVPSVPCFELWFLLHFADIQAFFHRDEIYRRLRQHIAEYDKGAEGIYAITEANLAEATARALRLQARFTPFAGTDPYTNANEVVSLLQQIGSTR